MIIRKVLLCFFIFIFFSEVNAASVSRSSETSKLLSISYQNADIATVFETLSKHEKVNILLSAGVSGEISINLYEMTLDDAIHIIAMTAGLAVQKTKGSYIISQQGEVGKDVLGGLTEVRSFKVQYSDVEQVEGILEDHLSRYGKITTLTDRNLLIVEDKPAFLKKIQKILFEIDKQPVQILIEAKILDVSLTDEDQYGIDWTKIVGEKTVGVTGLNTPTSGFFFTLFNKNIDLKLNALANKGRTRTLSTPKLLALENRKASVIIGKQLGFRTTTTINQVTTESVEFIDSGIILTVTPSIDNSGRIMLDIHPEISDGVLEDGIPQITTTAVTTQLLADDGQAVFIAGLIKNTLVEASNGVPVLSDIPYIGRAFSNDFDNRNNTETVVIITPHIIRTEAERLGFSSESDFAEVKVEARKSTLLVKEKFSKNTKKQHAADMGAQENLKHDMQKVNTSACKERNVAGFLVDKECN